MFSDVVGPGQTAFVLKSQHVIVFLVFYCCSNNRERFGAFTLYRMIDAVKPEFICKVCFSSVAV